MCHSEPNIHGMTLSIGDELGDDLAPTCCDDEMGGKDVDTDGHQEYTCSCCGTVLEVDDGGLVWDIRQKAAV